MKVTTWAAVGVQLKVVVPCGSVFVGEMLAVVGLPVSDQNSTLVPVVVFVTEIGIEIGVPTRTLILSMGLMPNT